MFSAQREAQITAANRHLTELVEACCGQSEPSLQQKEAIVNQVRRVLSLVGIPPMSYWQWKFRVYLTFWTVLFKTARNPLTLPIIILASLVGIFWQAGRRTYPTRFTIKKSRPISLQAYWKRNDIPSDISSCAERLLDIIYLDTMVLQSIVQFPGGTSARRVVILKAGVRNATRPLPIAIWIDYPVSREKQRQTKLAPGAN